MDALVDQVLRAAEKLGEVVDGLEADEAKVRSEGQKTVEHPLEDGDGFVMV